MKIIITENQYEKIKAQLINEADTTASVGAYRSAIIGLIRGKMAYEVKMKDVGEKKRYQEEMIVYNLARSSVLSNTSTLKLEANIL